MMFKVCPRQIAMFVYENASLYTKFSKHQQSVKLKLRWKTKLVAGQQDVIASSAVGGSYPLEVLRYNSRLWSTFWQITYETQLILMCVCLIKVLWISYHNFQARQFCSSSLKVMLGILIGKIGSEKPLGSSAAFLPESPAFSSKV